MKKIPVEQAVGRTLCHDLTAILPGGYKGVRFKRGHIIADEDIPSMKDIGKFNVFVWDPEQDEVHEDDAAAAAAEACAGANTAWSAPSEGKISITSTVNGLFRVNADALDAINDLPDYTIACRPDRTPVVSGEKLAGARIVPLVTKRSNMEQAVTIAENADSDVFSVIPYQPLKTGVVITGSEVYYGRIQDKFEPILRDKLADFGADILGFTKCPDDTDAIKQAILDFKAAGARVILLTGGMSVDPDDVTPAAIRESGAQVLVYGVPMQPGNMLTVAYLEDTVLLGVPGASMHSRITSAELLLPRIYAGERLTKKDFSRLGVGGLCMMCKTCHYPVCHFGRK